MEFIPSWGVERVWGEYNYYNTGEPAADKYAFVIDTGISLETNDLNVNTEWARSFVASAPDPFNDGAGHGTAVASVIGARADSYGLTGVAPGAQVVPIKVFSNNGITTNKRVQAGCEYVMDVILANDIVKDSVVNISLGSRRPDIHPIIEELNAAGITVVVSAGNSAADVDGGSPASYGHLENVYTISSTTEQETYSGFTNYDDGKDVDDVDFSAPGSAIAAYGTDGRLRKVNGTSFSAPHVAGLFLMGRPVAGPTFELSTTQRSKGMVPDPEARLELVPETIIEYVEVEKIVEIEKIIEVQPPQTTFVGDFDSANRIKGSKRDDVIIGGSARDVLKGRRGDDYIVGNGGVDKVRGGQGSDTFVCSFDGVMHIKDFDADFDTLALPSEDFRYEVNKKSNTNVYCDDTLVAKITGYI